jgi:hypothetical protein
MKTSYSTRQRTVARLLLAALVLARSTALAAPAWFDQVLVGMEIGPTGAQFGHSDPKDKRYCARFDGREIVRHAVAAQSEYLVMWVRDGDYAYYDSKLLPKAPGLGLRDPLAEALAEARPHQLPIIAYCVVQQGGHFLKAHPEWEMRGADGQPLGRFCLNSGYLEAMKQIVAEELAYGIDGFHLDMLDQGFGPPYGCWCGACQVLFQKESGHPLPKGAAWDAAWDQMLEFRYRSSERFEKALAAHIKSLHPRASVDFNYHGNPPFSFEVGQRPVQHAGNGDFITGETGVWGFSALTVGLNAQFYRAAAPRQRVQVAMQRGVRMYHDQTTRPLNDLRWEMFTLLAHGAFVTMVDKSAFEGWLDPVAYERFGQLFREVQARRAHFGQSPVQEVGIYYSSRTRDWVGRAQPSDFFMAFQGAHKAMVFEHIPWGVLHEENLSLDGLKRFPVVLLPNVGILSEKDVGLLRRYVEEGGQVVATGLSGCYDRLGILQSRTSLEALAGARLVRKLDSTDNWVRFPQPSIHGHLLVPAGPANWPFLVRGPAAVLEAATAEPFGELLPPLRTELHEQKRYPEDWPLSPGAPAGPALLLNAIGKGRVLTIAASPDWASASDHHLVEVRKLLAHAVRALSPAPRIRISAPATVEAVVTDDPAARLLRVHLLGYNAPPQTTPPRNRPYVLPSTIEDAPIFRVAIELDRPVIRAEALAKTTEIKASARGVEATVNDVHEVLLLFY